MVKIASKGTAVQKSIAAVFTTIAQVETITAPDAKVGVIPVPTLDGGVGIDKIATGYVDSGMCVFSGFLDPILATHKTITADITVPAITSWKVLWSDAAVTAWAFSALVTKFTPRAAVGEALRFDAELEVTGLVTYPA